MIGKMGNKNKYNIWLKIAIFCVFLTTPIESIEVFGDASGFSVVKLSFLFLVFVWFLFSRKLDNSIFIKYYIVLFAYFTLGLLWSINAESSFRQLSLFLLPTILMCSIISKNLNTHDDFRLISSGYLVGCGIMSLSAFSMRTQILSDAQWSDMERITALGQDANEMAFLICIGVAILLHFLGGKCKAIIKVICWVIVAFWSFTIISTGSRTGAIVLASLFLVFLLSNKKRLVYLLPLFILSFFFILQYVSSGIVERLLETSSSIQSNDLSGRGEIWRWGWAAFLEENVLLGVGYDNFSYMLTIHGHIARASHNTYLSYLVCGGFLGFILFLAIIVRMFNLVLKAQRIEKKWNLLYYVIPLFLAMMTLETSTRRWFFLLGIILYKYYLLIRNEHSRQVG